MDYLTAVETAKKWNVSSRMIAYYCEKGRIKGAVKKGKSWLVPVSAEKPVDKRSFAILALFVVIQFGACSFQEEYMGNPWYLFILFMPLMIYGGGLEEIGWQGVFQPILQKRLPFLAAAITGGFIWSIWHLPLWFIPNSSQSSYSFTAFTLFCITLGVTLAAAHKITGSIWVSVLLHAWSNTVLGGMYSLTSLYQFPNARTLIISMVQILAVTGVLYLYGRKQSFYR